MAPGREREEFHALLSGILEQIGQLSEAIAQLYFSHAIVSQEISGHSRGARMKYRVTHSTRYGYDEAIPLVAQRRPHAAARARHANLPAVPDCSCCPRPR